jgi:hypothetical protein
MQEGAVDLTAPFCGSPGIIVGHDTRTCVRLARSGPRRAATAKARTEPEGLGGLTANGATRGEWSWQLPGTQDSGQIGQATHSPPTPYGRFPP